MTQELPTMVVDVSTKDLIDPLQLGWVDYREDNMVIRVKVIRARNGWPFISLPTLYKRGIGSIDIIRYENARLWEKKRKVLLEAFKNHVGAARFFPSEERNQD